MNYKTYDDYLEDGEIVNAMCYECESEYDFKPEKCEECGCRRFLEYTREDLIEAKYE